MFVLLRRVRAWRAEMLARGELSPAELSELEDHLLEEARRLVEGGRPDEEAFTEALRRIGTGAELLAEFRLAHELSGASAGAWLRRLLPWGIRLCRWAQAVFVVCLPGLVMALPAFIAARILRDGRSLGDYLFYAQVPAATSLAWSITDFAATQWWWLLPPVLAALLLPTAYRIRHLRDRTDSSVAGIIGEEMVEARPFLLTGLVAYPLVGIGFLQVAFAPLFRMLDML